MKLGDTTQVHVLKTTKGDRLVGRVIGFDDKEITFLFMENTLTFPLEEVEKIEVQSKTDAPPSFPKDETEAQNNELSSSPFENFVYAVRSKDGTIQTGILHRYSDREIRLVRDGGFDLYLPIEEVESIELTSKRINEMEEKPVVYQNLNTTREDRFEGQLIDYRNGTWEFMMKRGAILKFRSKDIQTIRIQKIKDLPEDDISPYRPQRPVSTERFGGAPSPTMQQNFLAPNGFMLKRGESEYRNTEIFFNTFDYGISDHFTVGAGLFSAFSANALSLRGKLGASLGEKLHLSVGGQLATSFGIDIDAASARFLNTAVTIGTRDEYLTMSIGRGRENEYDDVINFLSLTGSIRVDEKWRIFTEFNRFSDENNGNDGATFVNFGVGWFKGANRVDFGVTIFAVDTDFIFPFPIAAYSHSF